MLAYCVARFGNSVEKWSVSETPLPGASGKISFTRLSPNARVIRMRKTSVSKWLDCCTPISLRIARLSAGCHGDIELEKIITTDKQGNITEKNIKFIEISDLSYKYPSSDSSIIEKLNLDIRLGDYIGIYGKSGSGKSTFINLFSGLLKQDEGDFLLNDNKIDVNSSSWKKNIGYVPQSIFLNNETIRENIAFGEKKENINNAKVIEVLKKVQLYNFVTEKKDGIDTVISDNSLNLSGGQIQRIGIARALYRNPKILIFDESTNSLDFETEKEFMKVVYKLREDKIVIFVSHKISLLEDCNKIYEFKNKNLYLKTN
jgi:ABC-type multidrug transport system fused ATPase/permease subunit